MNDKFLITTTSNIENFEIERYLEIISTNVVIGTNFFSDFGASISDLFGGYSNTYQNKLQEIYDVAIENLKKKAKKVGANAIIGLNIDFDEISGKGKSMFMISALGTAIIAKKKVDSNKTSKQDVSDTAISYIDLNNEVTRIQLIEKTKNKELPSAEEWTYLLNNPIEEISEALLDDFILIYSKDGEYITDAKKLLLENFPNYILNINKELLTKILYDKIDGESKLILEILNKKKLFNGEKIKELIKKGYLVSVFECLKIDKKTYSYDDIKEMNEIIGMLENLPDTGRIEMSKGLLSKSTEVYICPKGHKNKIDDVFCQHQNSKEFVNDCNLNIRGVTPTQLAEMEVFKLKVSTLEKLLKVD